MTNPTPETVERVARALQEKLSAVGGLPWAVRSQPYDDWGMIRAAPDSEGREFVVANARAGMPLGEGQLQTHRENGTDPYGPIAELIVAAVNAAPMLTAALTAMQPAIDAAVAKAVEAERERIAAFVEGFMFCGHIAIAIRALPERVATNKDTTDGE